MKKAISLIVLIAGVLGSLFVSTPTVTGSSHPSSWAFEWPKTDFNRHQVAYSEILSGGPPKDGIPPIDDPVFVPVADAGGLVPTEPVIGLVQDGEAKAYPLRVMTWHEIVNDEIAGIPVTVTYCPLCNSSIVFDRRFDGEVLDFGTTGKLRNSDLVMYDRQTESWWQQFTGTGIVGEYTGRKLKMIPSRLESWAAFKERAPNGRVLIPNNPSMRDYGRNPYVGYDSAPMPFLYRGNMPEGIEPMIRVVAVGARAWSLPLIRDRGRVEDGDLVITWSSGQNSALDGPIIAKGRDVGGVVVQREVSGIMQDVVHDVTFAFVFHAFHPNGKINHL